MNLKDLLRRPLAIYPSSDLRNKSLPVEEDEFCTEELETVIGWMFATMEKNGGIGLAAPQVKIPKRIFVTRVEDERFTCINPTIVSEEGEIEYEEGCLSIPGVRNKVKRSRVITLGYYDFDGNYGEHIKRDLHAVCCQHELDHLDGKLFIDYMPKIKQAKVANKVKFFLRKNKDYGK